MPSFESGKPLGKNILVHQELTFPVIIPEVPELPMTHKSDRLPLSGKLTFQFAHASAGSANLASESKIIVNQIFISGFNIDEFL